MRLNMAAVQKLLDDHKISKAQTARKIGVSRGALSNALASRRGAGRKMLAGLLRAFPDQTIDSLTIS